MISLKEISKRKNDKQLCLFKPDSQVLTSHFDLVSCGSSLRIYIFTTTPGESNIFGPRSALWNPLEEGGGIAWHYHSGSLNGEYEGPGMKRWFPGISQDPCPMVLVVKQYAFCTAVVCSPESLSEYLVGSFCCGGL